MINKDQEVLVVVESSTKAPTIKKLMTKLGFANVQVIATLGHFMEVANTKESYKNTGIYPDENFKLDWELNKDKLKNLKKIKEAVAMSDLVILATDDDNEGERIAKQLVEYLKLPTKKYLRIRYQSITESALEQALNNPSQINSFVVEAAEARLIVDKLTGFTLSPIAKYYIGAKSVGRCQSAGLKLVVDKEKRIINFTPEIYYYLDLEFNKNGTSYAAGYVGDYLRADFVSKVKFNNLQQLNRVKRSCTGAYFVSEIIEAPQVEASPIPFCTATFQQAAITALKISAKDAMHYAQKLFESGKCTYMRTDSTIVSSDFKKELEKFIATTYGKELYRDPKVKKANAFTQEGHECLRVTNLSLTPEKFKNKNSNSLLGAVYELIWKRTVMSALPAAEYNKVTYVIRNEKSQAQFNLSERFLTKAGYKIVDNSIGNSTSQFTFSLGEGLENSSLIEVKEQSKPETRYTAATLIKDLQDLGIGRPSTYATIIDTILSPTRGYCDVVNNYIIPTDCGIQLSGFLDRAFSTIINLEATAKLESNLDLISVNTLSKLDFLNTFFVTLEETVKNNHEVVDITAKRANLTKICPKCGAQMVLRRSRYGRLLYGCSNYPVCTGIIDY